MSMPGPENEVYPGPGSASSRFRASPVVSRKALMW